jgi:hypothetical protein
VRDWKTLPYPEPVSRIAGQSLVYLVAASGVGHAFVMPAVQKEGERPRVIPLPHMTTQNIEGWLVRSDDLSQVSGGIQLALDHKGVELLRKGIHQMEGTGLEQALALPFHQVANALPETMETLRQALRWMEECWRAEADILFREGVQHQKAAALLCRRLELPLGELLDQGTLEQELNGFLYEAELEWLLPLLSERIMVPLRQGLNDLGLREPTRPITFFPLGSLGRLPLHKTLVPDPRSGAMVPFEDTCRLNVMEPISPPFPPRVEYYLS